MSLSLKMSVSPRSLLEAMPKYSLKSRPRCWCSFFRQILTTGIYPSVVFWFWPVIKPASPDSSFKRQFCDLLCMFAGGVPISRGSSALYATQQLGLHSGGNALHSASLVTQAGWWLPQFPSYSHNKLFFSSGNEGCVSWDRFCPDVLTPNPLCWPREHT